MTESPEELAAVEQLLGESDALRGWLARLQQAPGAIPDAVRERVRADYQRRLDQVTAGLRAHADVISAKLHDDRSEHAGLHARATAAREALAEAGLRHAVGEYDDERFEAERRRHSSDLETYDLSLGAVAERIIRLEEIHALVEGAPRTVPAADEAGPTEPIVVPEVHAFGIDDFEPLAIAELAPDSDEVVAVFDESGPDEQPRVSDAPMTPGSESGPLSFRPSGLAAEPARPAPVPPTRPRPFESAPPLGIPAADVPPRFIRPGDRLAPAPAPPAAPPEPSAKGIGAEPTAAGPAPEASASPVGRTLRCGECGAMNRPLEWYCEKCGAELTAV